MLFILIYFSLIVIYSFLIIPYFSLLPVERVKLGYLKWSENIEIIAKGNNLCKI